MEEDGGSSRVGSWSSGSMVNTDVYCSFKELVFSSESLISDDIAAFQCQNITLS